MPTTASRRLNVLVVSSFMGGNANVIRDYLFSFRRHSRHQYYYVFDPRVMGPHVDFGSFDVILLFWSLYLLGPELAAQVRERIRKAPALKVLFLQDEYRDVRRFNALMAELGVNVMCTCVAESDHETFYPRALVPSLESTYTVLTGYVPTYLDGQRPDLGGKRPIDIGYRSRNLPYYLGDLGREKKVIADRFGAIAAEHDFSADISTREEDRLYGRRWVRFLRESRFVLGSASGASVVDFTGEIRQNCERHLTLHAGATYEDVKARFFAGVDWKVVIDTVSPRIFEAAALGCTMVHHEGHYAGIIQPDVHYIRVRRDYANIGEVLDRMRDAGFCRALARRAYEDLIGSGRYGYPSFVRRFDDILDRHARIAAPTRLRAPWRFYGRNFVSHGQALVPFRDGYAVLPSRRVVRQAAKAVLRTALRGTGTVVPLRIVDDPLGALSKLILGARVVRRSPALRAIVAVYRRHRDIRQAVPLYVLMNDLVKIDIVARARRSDLCSHEPFTVDVDFDPSTRLVTLSSRAPSASPSAPPERFSAHRIGKTLRRGEVSALLWDHAGLSSEVMYRPFRPGSRWFLVGIGPGGIYRFEALTLLCRRSPDVVGAALATLLGVQDAVDPEATPQSLHPGEAASPR